MSGFDLPFLLMLQYGQRRVIVPRKDTYESMDAAVRAQFPEIPFGHHIRHYTMEFAPVYGQEVEISPAAWPILISHIKVLVIRSFVVSSAPGNLGVADRSSAKLAPPPNRSLSSPSQEVEVFEDESDDIDFAKPVIYLLTPGTMLDAEVKLSIVPEWTMTTLYPVVPITPSLIEGMGEAVEWSVQAHPDGTLHDKTTGLDVSYLFWEARSNGEDACGDGVGPGSDKFVPGRPTVDTFNSVLLPLSAVPQYLDTALKALGLHVEARTSFITYWLPSMVKHTWIALRFVPQSEYEKAAPLEVSPKPDIVVRVFMLFKGILGADLEAWAEAEVRGREKAPSIWESIVLGPSSKFGKDVCVGSKDASEEVKGSGVVEVMQDKKLFRVLEWGGAEV